MSQDNSNTPTTTDGTSTDGNAAVAWLHTNAPSADGAAIPATTDGAAAPADATPAKPKKIVRTGVIAGVTVVLKGKKGLKKGYKQPAAAALFNTHVIGKSDYTTRKGDTIKVEDNSDFVRVLEDALDMTTAGARTYAYNCQKAFKANGGVALPVVINTPSVDGTTSSN